MNQFESERLKQPGIFENATGQPNTTESNFVPTVTENDEILEMRTDFDFSGFQVVRREFFAHLREPAVTFNNYKFYVNAACLSKFPQTEYAQILINSEKKILALRPCYENTRDSFKWCNTAPDGKRKTRQVTGRVFFAMIVDMMGWNSDDKYKILGNIIHSNGEYLLAFDLTSTEVYKRTSAEGEKRTISRIAAYPTNWKDQFGVSYLEHKDSMKINIVDGYAVYSIKGTDHNKPSNDYLPAPVDNSPAPVENSPVLADNSSVPADNSPVPADNSSAINNETSEENSISQEAVSV